MASLLRFLALCLLLNLSLPAIAGTGIGKDELDAQKELLLLKIDSGKELAQKDVEAQGKRLDALDKRIDDQVSRVSDIGNAVDRFTAISGWIGILITVLLASGGLVGYFSIRREAKEIAGSEANETASKWFAENEAALRARIDSLHTDAQNNINNTVRSVHDSATEAKAVIERVQKDIGTTQTDTSRNPDSDKDTETLQRRTDELKAIPENSYSFDDWNTRAFAAYKAGQLEEAALYWGNATKTAGTDAANSAKATFYRAITFGNMEKHDDEIALYDQLIDTYADSDLPALREQIAKAMSNKAFALGQMEKHEEEIALYDRLVATYSDDQSPSLRELVAQAMFNKAVTLGKMEKYEEEIALYDRLIATYADDTAAALRKQVTKAMGNKAFTLGQMKRYDEAIALCDRLITTHTDNNDPAYRERVARATACKAFTLGQMKKYDEANALYDHLIDTYADDKPPALREMVAKAMGNKAFTLIQLEKYEDAITLCDQLITTHADNKTPALREKVAQAMGNKAFTLGKMEKYEEAIALCDQLISTHADAKAPGIREQVAHAMNGNGYSRLMLAKKNWKNPDQAFDTLRQAETNLQTCLAKKPQWGMALGNLAYVQWLLGNRQSAEQSFRTALAANEDGGEALHRGTLDDINQHPIPEDIGFRELVGRLWVEYQANPPTQG